MATLKERVDKHDREIAAIRKLIHTGMKMLVKLEEEVRELAASQRETDRQLQAFIRSLRRGSNGHTNN
jgi:Xaa-Pro aminopeptidase